MNGQMEGKTEHLVAQRMSRKTLKREVRGTTSAKVKCVMRKNSKKLTKGSAKTSKAYISYEYEMKSCLSWEFSDVFLNIDNWHESLKSENSAKQLIKLEPQTWKTETVDEILGNESLVENTNIKNNDRHMRSLLCTREDESVGTGECAALIHGTVVTHLTSPVCQLIVDVQNNAYTGNAGTSNETSAAPTGDIHSNQKQLMKNPVQADSELPNQTKKKQFKCSDCKKEFMCKSILIIHMRIHSGEKPFKCTECLQVFSQKGHLTRHHCIHTEEKPFKCTKCPQVFSRKSVLRAHQRAHSGTTENSAGTSDETSAALSHDIPMNQEQLMKKQFKCSDCLKEFMYNRDLIVHMRIHSGEKAFKCTECPQLFSQKRHLMRHRRIHTGEKPFKCTKCPQVFSRRRGLRAHQRAHSGTTENSAGTSDDTSAAPSHDILTNQKELMKKQFKCSDCLKEFMYNRDLIVHMRIHSGEKPFKCTECPQLFSQKSHFMRHHRIHTGEKPFKCTKCPQVFSQRRGLRAHQRAHSGTTENSAGTSYDTSAAPSHDILTNQKQLMKKQFKCSDCQKEFMYNRDLIAHMLIHSGDKPFKCTECSMMFSQKIALTTHQHIHSGEKPLGCSE